MREIFNFSKVAESAKSRLEPELSQARRAGRGERAKTPEEKAQRLWDLYQDIKNSWLDVFKERKKVAPTEALESAALKPKEKEWAGAEESEELKSAVAGAGVKAGESAKKVGKKRKISSADFFDPDNESAQKFKSRPAIAKQLNELAILYEDEEARGALEQGMKKYAEQWVNVNGNWEEYKEIIKEGKSLEKAHEELTKRKFEEKNRPASARKRTLNADIANIEIALEESRQQKENLIKESSHELALRVLAEELKQRHKELESPGHFMWFDSRKKILEKLEDLIAASDTLRLIVLEGEAGTGKTTFAKIAAKIFTGAEPVKVEIGSRTKADTALFADKDLLAGSSPTVYQPILSALTGKETAAGEVQHDGKAVFLDELNKGSNDEVGNVATYLDSVRRGEASGYALKGASPDDIIQPKAMILAAQNPAGERFRDRIKFTPEVERKLILIQLEYFPQTPEDPELYESFLVALMDADGQIRAKREELAPAFNQVVDPAENIKEYQLDADEKSGGILWRFANLLGQSYENIYHRENILTRNNSEAWLLGKLLTPGDIFVWLREYQVQAEKGESLSHFLSQKYHDWLSSSFQSQGDSEDRQLYEELGKKFGILVEEKGKITPLEREKINFNVLMPKDIAQLSSRIPRLVEQLARPPEVKTGEAALMDLIYEGEKQKKVSLRLDKSFSGQYHIQGDPKEIYFLAGQILECEAQPELAGKYAVQKAGQGEYEIIEDLSGYEKEQPAYEFIVKGALNPYHEALTEAGLTDKKRNPEKQDLTVNLQDILKQDREAYEQAGIAEWVKALPEKIKDFKLMPEQIELIKSRVERGEIPIFMPGRQAQIKGLKTAIEKLKPLWLKDGQEQTLDNTYLWDYLGNLIQIMEEIAANQDQAGKNNEFKQKIIDQLTPLILPGEDPQKLFDAVLSLPEKPYIFCAKPSQSPDARTKNKTLSDQIGEWQKIRQENSGLNMQINSIAEYLSLQNRFIDRARNNLKTELRQDPQLLIPLDDYTRSGGTFIRFIDLPVSSGGFAPLGYFDSVARRLLLSGFVLAPYANGGCRFSVRV